MNIREYFGNMALDYFNENLSGSGLDCDWSLKPYTENSKNIILTTSFHCMNGVGYYDGYQDLQVVIPINDVTAWKLQFTGYRKENYIYLLREYLEDTIHYAMEKFVESLD